MMYFDLELSANRAESTGLVVFLAQNKSAQEQHEPKQTKSHCATNESLLS